MRTFAILCSLCFGLLVGCGSKSAAPASEPDNTGGGDVTEPADNDGSGCCCDYIEETGDGDEMAEQQVYEPMDPNACADIGGSCREVDGECRIDESADES